MEQLERGRILDFGRRCEEGKQLLMTLVAVFC